MTTTRITAPTCFLALLGLVLVSACGKAALFCDENTPCTDPNRPFCDLNGDFPDSDGIGKTCIANPIDAGVTPMCSANETVCEADVLVSCDATGNIVEQTDCLLGCHDTEVRCNKLDPSNGLAEHLDDAEANGPDIQLGDGATFNTTNGEVRNGDGSIVTIPSVLLPAPTDGVEVRVFKVGSVTLGDTVVVGDPAMALVSGSSVEFLGDFVVQSEVGTGGSDLCEIPDYTTTIGTNPGFGGGGFGTAGGRGGNGDGGVGFPGGIAAGQVSLIPLRGGCRGDRGCTINGGICQCTPGVDCSIAGRGGGAVHFAALSTISIGASGFSASLQAQGEGAEFGGGSNAGIGGGSGGAILLEAPRVSFVGGLISANGGGGACQAADGSRGSASNTPNGASCAAPNGGGGAGGTTNRSAEAGAAGTGSGAGGGGGGGVGRIRINTATSAFEEDGVSFSPNPSLGFARER